MSTEISLNLHYIVQFHVIKIMTLYFNIFQVEDQTSHARRKVEVTISDFNELIVLEFGQHQ